MRSEMNPTKNIFLWCSIIIFGGCSMEALHVKKANTLFDEGSYSNSILYYSKAIDENPFVADYFFFRGLAWLMKKEYDLATSDFSQTIELDNNYVEAYINRGSIWKEKENFEKSLNDYNKVVKLRPNDYRALDERAELLFIKKEFMSAILDYNLLIEKKYDLANTYRKRADAKYFILDYAGAVEDYFKSIILDPKIPYAYNNLAWLQATCVDKKYRNGYKAIYNAKKAVNLSNNRNFLHTLAAAYAEAGRFDRSIIILNEVMKNNDFTEIEILSLKSHLKYFEANKPIRKLPGE
jgi:tetratricopeptide (TPR) repeat protein